MTLKGILLGTGIFAIMLAPMFENPSYGFLDPIGVTLLWIAFTFLVFGALVHFFGG